MDFKGVLYVNCYRKKMDRNENYEKYAWNIWKIKYKQIDVYTLLIQSKMELKKRQNAIEQERPLKFYTSNLKKKKKCW